MSDLFDKLNVLVRSRLNAALNSSPETRNAARIDAANISLNDAETAVRTLRSEVAAALKVEDAIRKRMDTATTKMSDADQQADSALLAGDDETARRYARQVEQERRTLTAMQEELDAHRDSTAQLLDQVNQLESIVADRRAAETATAPQAAVPQTSNPPAARSIPINTEPPKPDDDLERRRARLSKPDGS